MPTIDLFQLSIAHLRAGQEITLKAGYGDPATQEVRTVVIIWQEGQGALTNDGTRLIRQDAPGITLTGKLLSEGQYDITPSAQQLLEAKRHQAIAYDEISWAGALT